MTKSQFENGTSFKVKGQTYKGDYTFTYDGTCICKESRSSNAIRNIPATIDAVFIS